MIHDDFEDDEDEEPLHDDQHEQIEHALNWVQKADSSVIHMPFRALADLTGPLTLGSVWYLIAFSGDGKTTLAMAMAEAWAAKGITVWYMGLETKPSELRVKVAAKALGLHPGDAMTGQLPREDYHRLQDELLLMAEGLTSRSGKYAHLLFSPAEFVTAGTLIAEARKAHKRGAKVFIIDHIDHIGGDGTTGRDASEQANKALLQIAKKFPMVYLATSQANNEAVRTSPLDRYQPLQPHHVWFPGVKRQVATGQIGVYRPMQDPGNDAESIECWKQDVKAVREKRMEAWKILARRTMALNLMKHRDYGEREGQIVKLYTHKGQVRDRTSMDDATDYMNRKKEE